VAAATFSGRAANEVLAVRPVSAIGTQRAAAIALADAADTLLRPLDPEERGLLRTLLTRIADHWQALSAARPD
jgi:hypothetical protein